MHASVCVCVGGGAGRTERGGTEIENLKQA